MATIGLLLVSALVARSVVAGERNGAGATVEALGGPGGASFADGATGATPGSKASGRTASGRAALRWVTTSRPISSGGMSRSYLLAEPEPAPTAKVPLIVVLHGIDATAQFEEQRTGLLPIVGPAVVVYPLGYKQSWNAGTCCGPAYSSGVNDLEFVTAVVHRVITQHPILSPKQVYLVGYSNGGKLAWDLACKDPSLFAAVGVYGAVPAAACPTPGPISAIEIAGLADTELTVQATKPPTVQAGFTELPVDTLVARLRGDDGCGTSETVTAHGVEQTTNWIHCANGARVAYSLYRGQNHNWPVPTPTTPSAESLMWSFFRSVGAT